MINILLFLLLLLFYILSIALILFILASSFYSDYKGAPFVANQVSVINHSFSLAKLNKKDTLLDLGCGNCITLQIAKNKFDVENLRGVEIAFWPYLLSVLRFRKSKNVKIIRSDVFKYDFGDATVIYAYLFPKILENLSDKLFVFLKNNPKARLVTPAFEVKWNKKQSKYIKTKVIKSYNNSWKKEINIYLYSI